MWRGQLWWRVVRFNKVALCDTNINHRVGRASLLIPPYITTQDTVLIIIIDLVIIHVQCVIITMGLITSPLVTTPGVFHS